MDELTIYFVFSAIGLIFLAIGWLGVLIKSFGKSFFWGLCNLLIPFCVFIFYIKYQDARKFLYIKIIGILFLGVAFYYSDILQKKQDEELNRVMQQLMKRGQSNQQYRPGYY